MSVSAPAAHDVPTAEAPPRSWRDHLVERPVLWASLAGSVALLLQALGYAIGWRGPQLPALALWYVGFVALATPFVVLLLAARPTPRQRLTGALVFTLLLYVSWLLANPVMATAFDETLHVTTLRMVVEGDGLFASNPMLPVSPHFPGLELATATVHWLTGLPLVACQVLVVVLARSTLVMTLFLLASRIGGSARVGGVVVLLYAASPQFYFFNAQFSYQTVAIAMLVASLYLLLRACDSTARRPWWPMLGVQVCLAALAVTHHLTSWMTLGALWLLALLFWAGGEPRRARLTVVTAEIGTMVVAAWTALIAPLLLDYLAPVFDDAGEELGRLVALEGGGRQVLADGSGNQAPTWEVLVMAGSMVLWCALLAPSAYAALRGRTMSRSSARLVPLGLAAVYPVLLLGRFSPTASEIADRASTFVTLAMALVVGVWLVSRLKTIGLGLAVPGALVLLLGGAILGGGPDWQRVPGPYIAGAEQRSVDADTIAVAQWAGRHLPAGSRIASDSTINRVLPNFSDTVPVTGAAGSVNVTELFLSREVDDAAVSMVQEGEIDFVVVDTRMVDQQVLSGDYYEGSNGYGLAAVELDAEQLGKFEGASGFDLVLDGPVQVYDVRSLRGEAPDYVDRAAPGIPGDWDPLRALATGLLALVALGLLLVGSRRRLPVARAAWQLAVSLPVLMAVGVVGLVLGFPPVYGALLLALLAGGLVAVWHGASRVEPSGTDRRIDLWLLVLVIVASTFVIAGLAAWQGLFVHPSLPAPSLGGSS